MAELQGWLRGFRTRAPTGTASQTFDRVDNHIEAQAQPSEVQGFRDSPRSSSLLTHGLGKQKKRQISTSDSYHLLPEPHQKWNSPDIGQLVESLQVLMMTRGSFKTIPAQYNSTLLQILESYGQHKADCTKAQKAYEEAFLDIESKEVRWQEREEDYRLKIKKLEASLASEQHELDIVSHIPSRQTLQTEGPSLKELPIQERMPAVPYSGRFVTDKDIMASSQLMDAQKRRADSRKSKSTPAKNEIDGGTDPLQSSIRFSNSERPTSTREAGQYSYSNARLLAEVGQGHDRRTNTCGGNDSIAGTGDVVSNTKTTQASIENSFLPQVSMLHSRDCLSRPDQGKRNKANSSERASHCRAFSFAAGDDMFEKNDSSQASASTGDMKVTQQWPLGTRTDDLQGPSGPPHANVRGSKETRLGSSKDVVAGYSSPDLNNNFSSRQRVDEWAVCHEQSTRTSTVTSRELEKSVNKHRYHACNTSTGTSSHGMKGKETRAAPDHASRLQRPTQSSDSINMREIAAAAAAKAFISFPRRKVTD